MEVMKYFKDRKHWALILGASSGLGRASAEKLAKEGMNLILLFRERRAEEREIELFFKQMCAAQNVELFLFNLDASLTETRTSVIKQIKEYQKDLKIKLVLHSIAKGNLKPLLSHENNEQSTLHMEDFVLTCSHMAFNIVDWIQDLLRADLLGVDTRVLGFTSEGNQRVLQNYTAVSAAKLALEGIYRSLAVSGAPYGLKANLIQAGVTDTPSLRKIPGSEQLIEWTKQRNPHGRLTTVWDVADVVFLLCRDESRWISGAIIPVDGAERLV
jgi:enoyl-[acyl-carrier protein] reductase III